MTTLPTSVLPRRTSHGPTDPGQEPVKRLLLGSVADKVARGAATPVLVYRPVDKSAPAKK
jgi:nucleotide-binding universal stress UspA family protein